MNILTLNSNQSKAYLCEKYLFAAPKEETISQFHDVGFVNGCNLFTIKLGCVVKGKFCNPSRFFRSDDFQALYNTLKLMEITLAL